jgi:hypothetical protein
MDDLDDVGWGGTPEYTLRFWDHLSGPCFQAFSSTNMTLAFCLRKTLILMAWTGWQVVQVPEWATFSSASSLHEQLLGRLDCCVNGSTLWLYLLTLMFPFVFETVFYCAAQAGFRLPILLPQPPRVLVIQVCPNMPGWLTGLWEPHWKRISEAAAPLSVMENTHSKYSLKACIRLDNWKT